MHLQPGASSAVPLILQDPSSLSPQARAQRRADLARAHRAVGVDPKYLSLPQGQRLWFVHVVLDLEVHAGCLGFTRHLHEYAAGATAEDAAHAVHAYFAAVAPEQAPAPELAASTADMYATTVLKIPNIQELLEMEGR